MFTNPMGAVAAWDGTNIVATPGLIDRRAGGSPSVSELLLLPTGVHAVGSFTIAQAGTDVAANLAVWDGVVWQPVPGLAGGFGGTGVADDRGAFFLTGDTPLGLDPGAAMSNGLFRWRDGRATALHNGLLREFEQPFFGGGGGLAGGSRAGLASFTPGDLVSVRDPASVQAIFAHEGRFYVLGAFDLAGPVRVRNWAVWEPMP